ncbi:hypothetical protein WG924_02085 [Tistrella sp. 25B02-3]
MDDLDAVEGVVIRVGTTGAARSQVHDQCGVGIGIGCRIDSGAPLKQIATATPAQHIIAVAALQAINAIIARQLVVIGRAGQVLDSRKPVTCGITAGAEAVSDVDDHGSRTFGIAGPIKADATDQQIRTTTPLKNVTATGPIQPVGCGIAVDPIPERRSDHVFDLVHPIEAIGVAACEIDCHRLPCLREIDGVIALTAEEIAAAILRCIEQIVA